MAHNFYAVKRGFDKKQNKEITDLIAEDWYEVAPLVKGYDNARYKGFDTKEEAETWLSVVDKTDAEKRAKKTIDKAKEEIGIEEEKEETAYSDAINDFNKALEVLVERYKELGWSHMETAGAVVSDVVKKIAELY